MFITIITINYNSSENTIKLLKSLDAQSDKNFKIIVVENNSEPKEKEKLKNYLNLNQNIALIENPTNLGFSGGNNVGIRKTLSLLNTKPILSTDENNENWITLLNNDTWVENNFISRLKTILKNKKGIVSIPLAENDKIAYCGKNLWLKNHGYHICDIGKAKKEKNKYAIGGAMAVNKNVFDKIGLLDEKYFIYFEDMDFSARARKAGFTISTGYGLNVRHSASTSTKKLGSSKLLHYHYRNALYFNFKNGSFFVKLLVIPLGLAILTKQIIKITINKNKENSLAILRGVADFYKNKMGKI